MQARQFGMTATTASSSTDSSAAATATSSSGSGGGGGGGGGGGVFGPFGVAGGTNLPVTFIGVAFAAIALFILVVAFVLLRIFIRNRRLRRLGIYVEDDWPRNRFVGGSAPRVVPEDQLAPPKLWEAKIADLGKGGGGAGGAAGMHLLEKQDIDAVHTWDALMVRSPQSQSKALVSH